jgi:hypothetical protein
VTFEGNIEKSVVFATDYVSKIETFVPLASDDWIFVAFLLSTFLHVAFFIGFFPFELILFYCYPLFPLANQVGNTVEGTMMRLIMPMKPLAGIYARPSETISSMSNSFMVWYQ